ncbi:MAG: nucleotide exchange factor GrpE [Candidatus Magasanikbacteria bacterium]|nr:nucleotide exchange factor GrpE [Candidatus Magasanikbacteria bacterium]
MPSKNKQKKPKVVSVAYIVNDNNQIFLVRSPKWQNLYIPPGGQIEHGETPEEAAIREMKEETNLDITDLDLLTTTSIIESEKYQDGSSHIISFQHRARLKGDNQEIILDKTEGTSYKWFDPEEAVNSKNVEINTKEIIKKYFCGKKDENMSKSGCESCEDEKRELKQGWQRALADYKNLQKEIEDRKSDWVKMSELQVLEEFIPVYNNFKLAIGYQPSDFNPEQEKWFQGVEQIMKQFGVILEAHEVEEIETVGVEFDPELHEAVGEEESDEYKSGIVIKELEAGYMMKGKVIKPAKVVVSK